MEQRRSYTDVKGKDTRGKTPSRLNTDAVYEVGLSHSSEESSVMGEERRAEVVQLALDLTTLGDQRRDKLALTRGIPITKEMVWRAYKKVRSNKGAAGIDNQTIEQYKEHLRDNLYELWNNLSSGSYFPVAVLEVEIPKTKRGRRKLGIPTISDRIAQQVIKDYLEPKLDKEFSEHSYGYRPLKNTHQAVEQVKKNVLDNAWVLDMDISKFFDSMSHEKLLKALERHVSEKWVLMYVKRWLTVPSIGKDKVTKQREKGTPQGGVISPLLANLFLHYAFDKWFEKEFPNRSFVRYADDIVVHSKSEQEAQTMLTKIKERLSSCELELNTDKTKIVYCKTSNRKGTFKTVKFDFLGFSFQPRPTLNKQTNKLFLSYDCSISRASETKIAEELRKSKFHQWTYSDLSSIAKTFNPKLRGWLNYYGKFRKYALNRIFGLFNWRLIKWAVKKYKCFKGSMRKAGDWIRQLGKEFSYIFVHWEHGFNGA